MTKVVIDPGVTVATKLQSWIGTAVSDTRFSERDVRRASAVAPTDASAVRSKVKPLLAAVSPLRTTSASVRPSALTAATMSGLFTSTNVAPGRM
jgi:hypothetical protein